MKIIIIGPIYPYKGGIAHYTGMMASSLQKEHDVEVISFSLQYPRFLYKKEQKDYKNDCLGFKNTKFILNTINPVSYFATAMYIKRQKPDLIIYQWWHPYFALAYWCISKMIKKTCVIIFVCHNVLPHEKFLFQKTLTIATLSRGNAYIVHSYAEAKVLESLLKAPYYKNTPLPAFDFFNDGKHTRKVSRETLRVSESEYVLLFFGLIREYKGLRHLINAMPTIISGCKSCKLLIVGDFFEGNKNDYVDLIKQCGMEEFIQIYSGYVSDNEVGLYFTACDVVVLPYESATQSGIVQVAYGFNKPVIATSVGGLLDVVIDGKTGFLIPPHDSTAIASSVLSFVRHEDKEQFNTNIKAEKYKFSWDRMNEVINELNEK